MLTTSSNSTSRAAEILIPVIRTAATISFALVPCSLGFVIVAVSEQLIRSILVGDDPVVLMGALQHEFPDTALEIIDHEQAHLVSEVVDLLDHPGRADLPNPSVPIRCLESSFDAR